MPNHKQLKNNLKCTLKNRTLTNYLLWR